MTALAGRVGNAASAPAPTVPLPTTPAAPATGAPSGAAAVGAATGAEAPRRAQRDLYIDTLRGIALVRVMMYHTIDWEWMPLVFPAMGIMFALGGSLMAGSLDRGASIRQVVAKRLRRLLIPFWVFAAAIVAVMLADGWTVTADLGTPLDWTSAWRWVLPLGMPPGSATHDEWVLTLWYVSAYLWLVLLSPALLWLFRKWPKAMVGLPLVAVLLQAGGLLDMYGPYGDIALQVSTYGACWMLGFAHHDGLLRRMQVWKVVPLALALAVSGIWWAQTYPDLETGPNVTDIPVASALYSLAAVLLLLRLYPDFSWMHRVPPLAWLVQAISARALTIYLWGNVAIFASGYLLRRWPAATALVDGPDGMWLVFAGGWVVMSGIVLCLGWLEDVAASRKPTVLPRVGARARRALA